MTQFTKSCVDNILAYFESVQKSEVLHSFISDHSAQKICLYFQQLDNGYYEKTTFCDDNKLIFENILEIMSCKIFSKYKNN